MGVKIGGKKVTTFLLSRWPWALCSAGTLHSASFFNFNCNHFWYGQVFLFLYGQALRVFSIVLADLFISIIMF